ncbi:MAG: DUF5106 domain-containing protein [Bacteroidales bacterium]|jgi:thiol-disulfide isomerase/thioredoxin|nr:DUF5106 domain-containing protein [Bacteroidales bacterium]NLK80229.1 DUF5106 domain-containing protein [Bacteroidales bacterium]HQB23235.1 DUF5106 domain-containing protein [Bacteroidales bacterium]
MKHLVHFIPLVVLLAIAASCSGKSNKKAATLPEFQPASVPAPVVSAEEAFKYRIVHYWDKFPFDDIRSVRQEGYAEKAFADFVGLLLAADAPLAREGIRQMVSRMNTSLAADSIQKQVLVKFNDMAEHFFYHPNSPYRNEELYLPVLEHMVSSPLPDTLEKARAVYLLELAHKNRPGSPATDFHFIAALKNLPHIPEHTVPKTLYSLTSPFILVYFLHPDCSSCKESTRELLASELITYLVQEKQLTILTIYPEEDPESWLNYLPNLPSNWLHAWNPNSEIRSENLYDLNAIPSLYLLDNAKKVLVKDALSVKQIEGILRDKAHFL